MAILLTHDWLTGMRGGEKCLQSLCRRWPNAELRTLLHFRGRVSPDIEQLEIRPSWLNRLPGIEKYYRYLLPLFPSVADKHFRAGSNCELVVSFSHCVAKSATAPPGVPHVCYCFSPMRYAWDMQDAYFKAGTLKSRIIGTILAHLRAWDRQTASRVTHFVAISETIRQRIHRCYDRDSVVIYPPVDTDFYTPAKVARSNYYLVVSAFAPYKRIDLAIKACTHLQRKLVLIGTGQDEARLRQLAGPDTQFLGWQPNSVIRDHMRTCRALIFPGEEDFGIVPVEAHSCGTPVIALGMGGATETVIPPDSACEPTGLWFPEPTVESLVAAIQQFEQHRSEFSSEAARQQALRFRTSRFESELFAFLDQVRFGRSSLDVAA